jgi:hypothetical protein
MSSNHIVFFTQLYYPDMTTTATIMTDLVEDLADYGLDVEVVRAQPTYIKNSVPQITQIKIGGSVDLGKSPRVECHNGVSKGSGRFFLPTLPFCRFWVSWVQSSEVKNMWYWFTISGRSFLLMWE